MNVQRSLQAASITIIAASFLGFPPAAYAGSEAPKCDKGGAGSTDCQVFQGTKGCFVESCDEGYYPCCTASASPQCNCVKGGGGTYEE